MLPAVDGCPEQLVSGLSIWLLICHAYESSFQSPLKTSVRSCQGAEIFNNPSEHYAGETLSHMDFAKDGDISTMCCLRDLEHSSPAAQLKGVYFFFFLRKFCSRVQVSAAYNMIGKTRVVTINFFVLKL